jgi:hypothetical protein
MKIIFLLITISIITTTTIILFYPTTPWLDFSHLPISLRPHRPLWIGLINLILKEMMIPITNSLPLPYFITNLISPKINAEQMLRDAQSSTGVWSDFMDTDGSLQQGLKLLATSLNMESALTPVGVMLIKQPLDMFLHNRLVLARKYHQSNNNNNITQATTRIKSPIFVIGMPRSGTTFLHQLLSIDTTNFRAPRLWEVMDPFPSLGVEDVIHDHLFHVQFDRWRRRNIMRIGVEMFKLFAKSVHAVHPISHMNAEECMPILAYNMMTLQFNTLSNVSKYNDWLLEQDQSPAFIWHHRFLNSLEKSDVDVHKPPQTQSWLLKAPWHLNHLDTLLKEYPDARILMPHRDPADMLTSLSSLHARFYGIVSDEIDPVAIGQYQRWQWEIVLNRFLNVRKQKISNHNIFDISFKSLTNNPIKEVERVYQYLGLTLTHEVKQKMIQWLQEDVSLGKKGAAGKHEYDAKWFGLDVQDINQQSVFKRYLEQFKEFI